MVNYEVLRLLFQFQTEYRGNPLFISGNAFRHAISRQVDASFGVFTDTKRLSLPKDYAEFFSIRIKKPFLTPNTQSFFSKTERKQKNLIFFTPSAASFDVINPPEGLIEYIKDLPVIQFGGLRNEGLGIVELMDHIFINVEDLTCPEEGTHLTLLSPLLHLPKFIHSYDCRQEYMIFWNNNSKNRIKIISPGQFFRLKDDVNIKKIALKGILRKYLFGKFGFGEFVVNHWPKGEKN